ncbi:MAG TPA: RNA methyltransferase [Acidimicrobiales bacterium]|nr:RNA methyltransferase [Acidimicrobiales bacterium]
MAEGAELIRTALDVGARIESLYVAPAAGDDAAAQEVCRRATAAGARVFPLAPGVLERVADTVTPQPVLAVLPMLAEADADQDPTAGAATTLPWSPDPGALILVLVDVRDPGNAGTVLRAADAAGVRAVVFAAESVDPYNPKTVRASAGSLFHVPFTVRPDPSALATALSAAGFRTLATVVRAGEDYAGLDWSLPTAVFFGNESSGLDPALTDRLDATVAIPMAGRAESLNVGVASAVVAFEAFRQRRGGGPGARSISGSGDGATW